MQSICDQHKQYDRLPDPDGACDLFYECVYNRDNILEPDPVYCNKEYCCGNHYSKDDMACVHPDKALCLPELRNLTCDRDNQLLSHPTNCSRYFKCSSTLRPTVIECPYDLHFSSELGNCVAKEVAQCGLFCSPYDNPMRPTLLPDPTNCAAFYKCHNGQPLPMLCPSYLHFSVDKKRCEFPFDVKCENGVRPKRF